MPKRIDSLSAEQRARFGEWADRWIEIGLRTGPADRPRFEAAVRDCYRYAGLRPPRAIVWVSSPLVVALAGPIASYLLALRRAGSVDGAVGGAVGDAVGGAVDGAVGDAVGGAVRGAVDGAVRQAISQAIARGWMYYLGGQFWVGGSWWWGGSWTSFFREVCNLELMDDLWDRARAYEATVESACWWWAHRDFVVVSERPLKIHRELVDPNRTRGWGSHRLHRDNGPSVVWPDGWGVWAIHGVRVSQQVVEAPRTLTVEQIRDERNAEVRRIKLERFGAENYLRLCNAQLVNRDDRGSLWRAPLPGDEDLVMVQVTNSTPEPDGSSHEYFLRVPPEMRTAHEAVAWTFGYEGKGAEKYRPLVQT